MKSLDDWRPREVGALLQPFFQPFEASVRRARVARTASKYSLACCALRYLPGSYSDTFPTLYEEHNPSPRGDVIISRRSRSLVDSHRRFGTRLKTPLRFERIVLGLAAATKDYGTRTFCSRFVLLGFFRCFWRLIDDSTCLGVGCVFVCHRAFRAVSESGKKWDSDITNTSCHKAIVRKCQVAAPIPCQRRLEDDEYKFCVYL